MFPVDNKIARLNNGFLSNGTYEIQIQNLTQVLRRDTLSSDRGTWGFLYQGVNPVPVPPKPDPVPPKPEPSPEAPVDPVVPEPEPSPDTPWQPEVPQPEVPQPAQPSPPANVYKAGGDRVMVASVAALLASFVLF
ncbi:hypothetical protein HDU81_001659 [Chytriomyces hyalinus]|nr:hypothetical protein HDU81_001659 [Chytriomyces hyalinus]